jgi:hypothetical protein
MLKEKILAALEWIGGKVDPFIIWFGTPIPATIVSFVCQFFAVNAAFDGQMWDAFLYSMFAILCAYVGGFARGYDIATKD